MIIDIKEKFALGILILSIFSVIFLLFFMFSQGIITGEVIEGNENVVASQQVSCYDSDNGRNYDVKGLVSYCADGKCSDSGDFCSGKILTEWYCEGNEKNYEKHQCEDCNNGVCLRIATKYTYPNIGGGSSGGGGSTGSSGGRSATVIQVPVVTHDIGELSTEQKLQLAKSENIKFRIVNAEYILSLQDYTAVSTTISSSAGSFSLNLGEGKKIDLNNDGISEIYMKLTSVDSINKKVQLTLNLASFYA